MSSVIRTQDLCIEYDVSERGLFFTKRHRILRAIVDVSLEFRTDEIVGIVGESGCGKSTLGGSLAGMVPKATGSATLNDREIEEFARNDKVDFSRQVQMIFQHPRGSLNPVLTGRATLFEVLRRLPDVKDHAARVSELCEQVGLSEDLLDRRPAQLSGGQCQRLSIARALAMEPKFLICDESIAALDVSIQAQIINLLSDLSRSLGMGIIFISHDLNAIRHFCDRVVVLYLGRVVELGPTSEVLTDPRHPYTKALGRAIPNIGEFALPDPELTGEIPSPIDRPSGCALAARCPVAEARCRSAVPPHTTEGNRAFACIHT